MVTSDEKRNEIVSNFSKVLVTDFDGTMTRHDFYKLARDELLPRDVRNFWDDYRAGALTHFEALSRYFAAIRSSEGEVARVLERMELDPELPASLERLRRAGWKVIVTSAGCDWYIGKLLDGAGVSVEVHANPGRFEPGRGLFMELPRGSRYLSPELGVDKAAVVRAHRARGYPVAFAGDGLPDLEAARLVPEGLRFARGDLAAALQENREPFRPFKTWSEIARDLSTATTRTIEENRR